MPTKKLIALTLLGAGSILLFCNGCSSPKSSMTAPATANAWTTRTFPKVGLELELPNKQIDVREHADAWFMFAYPLVPAPVSDSQYGMTIEIERMALKYHRASHPTGAGEDLYRWLNSEQLEATQRADDYHIYSRRDILTTNGFVYSCSGTVRGKSPELAAEMQRIFEHIKVLQSVSK